MDNTPATPALESMLKRVDALEVKNVALQAALRRFEAENAAFKASDVALKTENAKLKAEVERLTLALAAARKNSGNSSKPPSSDYVKPKPPPPPDGQSKRGIGGQRGHTGCFRRSFTPDQIDESKAFDPPSMTCACGGHLEPCPSEDHVQQQIDLPEQPVIRREYRARAYRCRSCGSLHRGKMPDPVRREGFVGNRLAAAWSFLNVKAHASHT